MLIAGAGPVGLVLALSLARRGHRVTVVEKLVDLLDQVRRAGTIHAATLEMLDDIGLYDRLEPRGLVAPLVHYWDRGDPEPIAVFDHAVLAGDTRFPHALQCDRLKLIEEALKMAADTDLIEVRVGTELVGFEQDGDSVTAVTETADGERQALRGTHLVGCEGAHSVVRKQLGIEFEGFAFPDRTMTLSVAYDFDSPAALRLAQLHPRPGRVGQPVQVDRLLAGGAARRCRCRPRLPPRRRCHRGRPAEVPSDRRALRGGVQVPLHRAPASGRATFRAGRVLLAGDAAHVNSPIGAMGMNSGIHDAVNLAAKLSSVLHGDADDGVLDRYVRQRRHVAVAHVQAITIRNKKLMAEADPDTRRRNRDELRRAADDPVLAREFLLRASLISSVREAAEIR